MSKIQIFSGKSNNLMFLIMATKFTRISGTKHPSIRYDLENVEQSGRI